VNSLKNSTKRIFWISLLLLLLAWSVCGQAAGITMVSVAGEKVNLRKGPSTQKDRSIHWKEVLMSQDDHTLYVVRANGTIC